MKKKSYLELTPSQRREERRQDVFKSVQKRRELIDLGMPKEEAKKPKPIASNIIYLKFLENKFAIAWGIVKREITRIIPTTLILRTIVKAIKHTSRYFIILTGTPRVRAYSSSKAI